MVAAAAHASMRRPAVSCSLSNLVCRFSLGFQWYAVARWGDVSARACWEDHLREKAAVEKFLLQTGARREAD